MSSKTSEIVAKLNLKPNPEGGLYTETFRDQSVLLAKSHLPSRYKVGRAVSTCIYYLLPSGSVSRLHRLPCAETMHFYLGEPLTLVELNETDGNAKLTCLGPDVLSENQKLQYTVPPGVWFGLFPTKDVEIDTSSNIEVIRRSTRDSEEHFSLIGCTCAPAFQFDDFEIGNCSELISRFPNYESLISLLSSPD